MNFIYYIIHTFTGCKDEDLKYNKSKSVGKCNKCGRNIFMFRV